MIGGTSAHTRVRLIPAAVRLRACRSTLQGYPDQVGAVIQLSAADRQTPLAPEDLERLAMTAYLGGTPTTRPPS
jgi:hypothetical protein